jgi:hypothetical protein
MNELNPNIPPTNREIPPNNPNEERGGNYVGGGLKPTEQTDITGYQVYEAIGERDLTLEDNLAEEFLNQHNLFSLVSDLTNKVLIDRASISKEKTRGFIIEHLRENWKGISLKKDLLLQKIRTFLSGRVVSLEKAEDVMGKVLSKLSDEISKKLVEGGVREKAIEDTKSLILEILNKVFEDKIFEIASEKKSMSDK